jgi:hypothetical protein
MQVRSPRLFASPMSVPPVLDDCLHFVHGFTPSFLSTARFHNSSRFVMGLPRSAVIVAVLSSPVPLPVSLALLSRHRLNAFSNVPTEALSCLRGRHDRLTRRGLPCRDLCCRVAPCPATYNRCVQARESAPAREIHASSRRERPRLARARPVEPRCASPRTMAPWKQRKSPPRRTHRALPEPVAANRCFLASQ